jgi:CHAT domain-containing protein/tetratricopeptide (TPR) repeat protein
MKVKYPLFFLMRHYLPFFILTLSFVISIELNGQCPTDANVYELTKKSLSLSPDENIPKLEKLYKTLLQCKDTRDSSIGHVCYNLSNNYYFKKDDKKALDYSKLALKYWQPYAKQRPKSLTFAAYVVAAHNHLQLNYIEAIKYYKMTINYATDNYWKGYCLKLIADLESELGDYEGMLHTLDKAQRFAENSKRPDLLTLMSHILNSKGMAFSRLKQEEKAITYFKLAQTYNVGVTMEEKELVAHTLLNLGYSYSNLKDFKTSEKYYLASLKQFTRYNFQNKYVHNNLGILYAEFHYYKKANETYKAGIDSLKKYKNSVEFSRVYYNFSNCLKDQNMLDSAIKTMEKAIIVFPLLDMTKKNFAIIRSKRTLFYIFRDYGKHLLAAYEKNRNKTYLHKSIEYFSYADSLLNLMRQEHQGQQSKSFWREHSRSFYESAIEACRLAKDAKKAFYFFEQSRAMLLLDDLKESHARELLSAQEQIKEKDFQSHILELQFQLENKPEQSASYKEITRKLLAVKDQFSEFKKGLEKKYPAYYSAKYGNAFKDLPTFQHWLKEKGYNAYVSYFIGDSATYAMKIAPTAVKFIKLPKDQQNLAARFINFCADADTLNMNFPAFLALSSQLYKRLIQSVGIGKGRVIISYDGHFLPFEALSRSAAKEDFLVRHCSISYTYSANFLLESIESKNHQNKWLNRVTFLGVAPVHFAKSLPVYDLPLSARSLQTIDRNFGGKLLLNNEASKQSFIEQFPKYRIVQLYTHADTTLKGPVFYLHDTPVYVSEIRSTQVMHTEMIVLSACKTALGKNVKGEGVFSLARSFSALGIPSLITTLWNVDEKATYTITELFYQNLKDGLPKDVALQKAKQTFMNAQTRNILPTLWASSILIGDSAPIEQSNWWVMGGIGILIFGSVGFVALKYRQRYS